MGWSWLTNYDYSWRFVRNVAVKATLLFVALNALYIALQPLPFLSRITFYSITVPGRERLPYSRDPADDYSVSVHRIEGMFAAHVIQEPKVDDEFRVLFLGDSGVWGWLLEPDETLAACFNTQDHRMPDGRRMVAYNLGYPVQSTLKDVIILEEGLKHDADAIIWVFTMQSTFGHEQLRHPVTTNNPDRSLALIDRYDIDIDTSVLMEDESLLDRSMIGERRELADLLRHQLYGAAWFITGIDHTNPVFFEARPNNLFANEVIPGNEQILPETGLEQWLEFDVLDIGQAMADEEGIPILYINSPMYEADGIASDLRYNDYYPRWAYDDYLVRIAEKAEAEGWNYWDAWRVIPNDQFTDTPFHYTPAANCDFANLIAPRIIEMAGS